MPQQPEGFGVVEREVGPSIGREPDASVTSPTKRLGAMAGRAVLLATIGQDAVAFPEVPDVEACFGRSLVTVDTENLIGMTTPTGLLAGRRFRPVRTCEADRMNSECLALEHARCPIRYWMW